jgi:hypothetical protein
MSWFSKQLNSVGLGGINQIWHPVNDVFKGPSQFFDKYAHMWDVGGRNDKFWPAFGTAAAALAGGSSLWGSSALGGAGAASSSGSGAAAPSGGGHNWTDIARQANQLSGYLGNLQPGAASSQSAQMQPWALGNPAEVERKRREALMQLIMSQGQPSAPGQGPAMAGGGKGGGSPFVAQTPGG